MTKIATIIGARPQFIKAAAVSRAIGKQKRQNPHLDFSEIIIHTGQHYDYKMSGVFFEELGIQRPHYDLEVGSGGHGHMTGLMLAKAEDVLVEEKPDWVLVYGDTNSTLAGALAATKLHIPVAHVEAGLRSFNRQMPEEINRILTDHISQLLFAPTAAAVKNLSREGISEGVTKTGDVMLDAFQHHQADAERLADVISGLRLKPRGYYLATVHRQENTDDPDRLASIIDAFMAIGNDQCPVILPLHPRTQSALLKHGIRIPTGSNVKTIDPVGYLSMVRLESNAAVILTDSGGVQKEAYFAGVPCVTLRDETEWVETVAAGVNFLAGSHTDSIVSAFERARTVDVRLTPGLYGDGRAAEAIVEILLKKA